MGDLADFGIAGMLHVLRLQRATGEMRIVAEGDEVVLWLDGGRLAMVRSMRLPLRLGRVLQGREVPSARPLHEAPREQEAGGHRRSLGTILLDRAWVSAADGALCVEEQSVALLARVMAAGRGTFIHAPAAPAPTRVATEPLDAERVLIEATRRVDELADLRAGFPRRYSPLAQSAQVGLSVAPRTPLESRCCPALNAGAGSLAKLEEVPVVDERGLLRTLAGVRQRGLVVAVLGAPGSDLRVPSAPAPSEADLARLHGDLGRGKALGGSGVVTATGR